MTTREAIASLEVLCHTRKHFPTCVNDKPECFQAIEMAIKSLEAWEKVKEELKESSYERYFEFGEYIGEDTQKIRIIGFDTAMDIINKHLAEVSE